jgi:hypothetical protein
MLRHGLLNLIVKKEKMKTEREKEKGIWRIVIGHKYRLYFHIYTK